MSYTTSNSKSVPRYQFVQVSIASSDGFVPNRQQAFTWANIDQDVWHITLLHMTIFKWVSDLYSTVFGSIPILQFKFKFRQNWNLQFEF